MTTLTDSNDPLDQLAGEDNEWSMLSARVRPRLHFEARLAALLGDESLQALVTRALENELAARLGAEDGPGETAVRRQGR